MSRSIETLDDFDLQISRLESHYSFGTLERRIALSSLYHIREERWKQGGDWEAVRYATEARLLLLQQMAVNNDHHLCPTHPLSHKYQLQDDDLLLLLVVHEVRLLAAIGRYDEAVSLAISEIELHEQLCGHEDHLLTSYAMEQRGLVAYTLGDSFLVAGRGLEAVPHLARAMRLRPCLLSAPHRLALALSEAARDDPGNELYVEAIGSLISATNYRLLQLIPASNEELHAPRLNLTTLIKLKESTSSHTDSIKLSLQPVVASNICELGDELNYQIALMQAAHLVSASSPDSVEIHFTNSDDSNDESGKQGVLKMALTPVRSQLDADIGAEEHLAAARTSLHWALHACYEALSKLKSISADGKENNLRLSWFHLQQARYNERVARHRPLLPSSQDLIKPDDNFTALAVRSEEDLLGEGYSHRKSVQGVRKIETNFDSDYWPRTTHPLLHYNQSILPRPLFIVGFFRSGSTLLESLLDAHPNIWGLGEQSSFASALAKLKQTMLTLATSLENEKNRHSDKVTKKEEQEESMDDRVAKQLYKHGKAVLLEMQRRCRVAMNTTHEANPAEVQAKCSGVLVDKMLGNYRNVGLLHLVFPKNALIVHTLRDPIDTLLSCIKARLGENAIYTLDSRSLAEEYALYLRSVRHWQKILPVHLYPIFHASSNYSSSSSVVVNKKKSEDDKVVRRQGMVTVRYDQLIAAPLATVNQILSLIQLPPLTEKQLSIFNQRQRLVRTASFLQARQPVYNSSVGGWLRHRQELQQFLVPALKEALHRHGLWDELAEARSKGPKKNKNRRGSDQPPVGSMNWAADENFDYAQLLQALVAHAAD